MSIAGLAAVLAEARRLVSRPDNDFAWSGWADASAAIREIEAMLLLLHNGILPDRTELKVLFAPTGPLQEVSLSSGWADEFLTLARSFDEELEDL